MIGTIDCEVTKHGFDKVEQNTRLIKENPNRCDKAKMVMKIMMFMMNDKKINKIKLGTFIFKNSRNFFKFYIFLIINQQIT